MPLWLLNWAGWLLAHWREAIIVVALLAVFVVGVMTTRSCYKKPIKLDEAAIQKAQKAIQESDRKAMIDVLAESDAKEAQIDAAVANSKAEAVNAAAESRKRNSQLTNDQLARALEERANP